MHSRSRPRHGGRSALGASLALAALSGLVTMVIATPPRTPLPEPEYSFDVESPTTIAGRVAAADVLRRGTTSPVIRIRADAIGLASPLDDIDAMSASNDKLDDSEFLSIVFSVDRNTVGVAFPDPQLVKQGVPHNVRDQALRGHVAGDQFYEIDHFNKFGVLPPDVFNPRMNNFLVRNNFDEGGSDFLAHPPTHASTFLAESTLGDAVDGMALLAHRAVDGVIESMYFSLSPDSPSLPLFPGVSPSGADIFFVGLEQGACCRSQGVCDLLDPEECVAAGGQWLGAGSTCDQCEWAFGACCAPESCIDGATEFSCVSMGGSFLPGQTCADADCSIFSTGACCWLFGCVEESNAEDCASRPSSVFFLGEMCEEIACGPAACCVPDGTCHVLGPQLCGELGGVYYAGLLCSDISCGAGPASVDGNEVTQSIEPDRAPDCQTPGACCTDETCDVIDVVDCAAIGGIWLEGQACEECEVRAACCLPFGGCMPQATVIECHAATGTWLGPGRDCGFCQEAAIPRNVRRFASAADLGLLVTDDIDAMIVFDENTNARFDAADRVIFSLAPGSPLLSTSGHGAADLFVVTPGMAPVIFAAADALGLGAPDDNVDALDALVIDHGIRACDAP